MIATREIARRLRAKRPERLTDPATPLEAKVARVKRAILDMDAARLRAERTPQDRRDERRALAREFLLGGLAVLAVVVLLALLASL